MRDIEGHLSYRHALSALALMSVLASSDAAITKAGVTLVSTPHELDQPIHGPVFVDLEIINDLEENVEVDLGPDRKLAFALTMTTPTGSRLKRKLAITEGIHTPGLVTIDAGERYQQRLVLNDWFAFPDVGTYTLDVWLEAPVRRSSGLEIEIDQKTRVVVNLIGDPQRLRAVCEALAHQAMEHNAERALEATHALSYVQEPICTPALNDALLAGFCGTEAVARGLARVGTAEAIDALLAAWKKDRGRFQYSVAWALYGVYEDIRDPEVRKRVEDFLREVGLGGVRSKSSNNS